MFNEKAVSTVLALGKILAQEPIFRAAVSREDWAGWGEGGVGVREVYKPVEWLPLCRDVSPRTCQFHEPRLKNVAGGRPYSS